MKSVRDIVVKTPLQLTSMKSVCVIVGKTPFERRKGGLLRNEECCSSLHSVTTAKTEFSSSISSIADQSAYSRLETDCRARIVCFDVDECNNIRKEVFVYPRIEDKDKAALFWSQKEVSRRRKERDAIVQDDNENRAHFIACVEELLRVPMRKRLVKRSIYSESDPSVIDFVSPVSQEEAIEGLSFSDYRGFEHHCVRVIVGLRRR